MRQLGFVLRIDQHIFVETSIAPTFRVSKFNLMMITALVVNYLCRLPVPSQHHNQDQCFSYTIFS